MSWRNAIDNTTDAFRSISLKDSKKQNDSRKKRYETNIVSSDYFFDTSALAEIESLLEKIGDRDVIVDACLPPQMAEDLRNRNVRALWVPAVLGDGVSDGEVERQLLSPGTFVRERVLLTRDVKFYRRIRNRAILVSHRASCCLSGRRRANWPSRSDLRKQLKKIVSLENS
jgi:hypothetical protein